MTDASQIATITHDNTEHTDTLRCRRRRQRTKGASNRTYDDFAQESNGGHCDAASNVPQNWRFTQPPEYPVDVFVQRFGGARFHTAAHDEDRSHTLTDSHAHAPSAPVLCTYFPGFNSKR